MNRAVTLALFPAALVAAGLGGYAAGQHGLPWPIALSSPAPLQADAAPAPSRPVIYYRNPAGLPAYSATPRLADDGRAFLPVYAGEDVSFDEKRGDDNVRPAEGIAENPSAALPPPGATPLGPKKLLFYRNPMGLPDTSPVPKKDSMGMDYIAVYSGDDEDGSTVKLSPGRLQRIGVRSEQAALRPLSMPVRASGTVQLDERRKSVIALRFDAYIASVGNVTTGTMVREGDPLMQVYGPDLLGPAAQYVSLLGDRSDGQALKSARRKLENYDVPESVIKQIERTRDVPSTLPWPSPRTGIVVERTAVDGMKANAGETLFRLADISQVWVLADIAESDLPMIAIGQMATVRARGTAKTFTGEVALIYPSINRDTRTARLRIELPNPDGLLLPDMYAQVEIDTGSAQPVLAVSDTALIDSGDRQVVLLDKGEGRFEPRPVTPGRRGGGYIEISGGLVPGDRVVVGANFLIDAESNLKAALQGMTPPQTLPPPPSGETSPTPLRESIPGAMSTGANSTGVASRGANP